MSKNIKESITGFLAGKGFYLALAVCLLGTGAAAWIAVDRTLGSINENNDLIIGEISSQAEENTWGFPSSEQANTPQAGIVVSEEPSTSSPTSQQSSGVSITQDELSEPLDSQTASQEVTYILPVEGEIFNTYSNGRLVKDETLNEWRTHNGIDIKAAINSPILAVANGTVSAVYNDPLWGYTVEIQHADGHTSVYCGLSKNVMVAKGDGVLLGQQIGTLEKVPAEVALEPHLHFGMMMDGNWVDPLAAMNKIKE